MEASDKGLSAGVTSNYLKLTDAAIRAAMLPPGKSQHYLHDTDQPGLAVRMRATGGRTWAYLFTKPGARGTHRKTLGAWPKFNEKAARQAATIAAGEVVKGSDPNDAKREAKRQQLAERQCTTLANLITEDGPYETSLTGRQVVNWKPAMSALRRGLKVHVDLAIRDLTRRQIMAAVDKVAKTGKRGAAKDLRKHTHTFLEWCVGEGYVENNVLAGYRAPKETRAQRVGRRSKGRALTDEEVIKVWHASGKLGTFGLLTRLCLLGGPRRSEPTMVQWQKHIMDDRITFDEAWTKMGLHHDVPHTHLVDEVLAAAKHFQRATSDYVFPSPKTGGQMSGFTKMVNRLVKESSVAKFTMHDLRRSLRTIMSRCGYDNEIQRLCVGQKPRGIDQVYNHDAAFTQKRIDGYALSAPTSTAGILRFGGVNVFDFAKGEYPPLADIAFYTLIARDDWISGQKEKAQKVVRALWKGLRFMKTNPEEAMIAVRSFFEKTPTAEFVSAWAQNLAAFAATPRIAESGMRKNYDFLREGEGKAVAVPLAASFTNEVVDAVAPSMG